MKTFRYSVISPNLPITHAQGNVQNLLLEVLQIILELQMSNQWFIL